jgi:hypothetical protein
MSRMRTQFGSLDHFEKGSIEPVNDDPKHYVFSNIFEVASQSKPFEKIVVGKNLQFVIEVLRLEGSSDWFIADHDEFAIVMDGQAIVEFIEPSRVTDLVEAGKEGSVRISGTPVGQKMGTVRLSRGHQALLPARCAYRLVAVERGVLMLQTILGDCSVEKWSEICLH